MKLHKFLALPAGLLHHTESMIETQTEAAFQLNFLQTKRRVSHAPRRSLFRG